MYEILFYASCSLRSFYFLAITFCNNTAHNISLACCLIRNNTEIPATMYGRIISGTQLCHMCCDDYHQECIHNLGILPFIAPLYNQQTQLHRQLVKDGTSFFFLLNNFTFNKSGTYNNYTTCSCVTDT